MKYTREGKEVTYIHYGSPAFDDERFTPAIQEGCWVKPKGGLWASPVDAQHGWKDWCEGEGFRECNEDDSFKFTVKDPKRIFYINSEEAFDDWYSRYVTSRSGGLKWAFTKGFNCGLDQIEIEKMKADGWDGLEISLTDHWPLYNYLYGWDCDSIVVFNYEDTPEFEERFLTFVRDRGYDITKEQLVERREAAQELAKETRRITSKEDVE